MTPRQIAAAMLEQNVSLVSLVKPDVPVRDMIAFSDAYRAVARKLGTNARIPVQHQRVLKTLAGQRP